MIKILEIAISQIGVEEDALHTNHGEAIKYQDAAGLPAGGGYPWCQSFFFWCGLQAYGAENPVPHTGGVLDCLHKAEAKGYAVIKHANATPQNIPAGCQFIIDEGGGKGHTGIVESVDADGRLHTIEGNSNNDGSRDGYEVCRQTKRHISDAIIVAYVLYDYPDAVAA